MNTHTFRHTVKGGFLSTSEEVWWSIREKQAMAVLRRQYRVEPVPVTIFSSGTQHNSLHPFDSLLPRNSGMFCEFRATSPMRGYKIHLDNNVSIIHST